MIDTKLYAKLIIGAFESKKKLHLPAMKMRELKEIINYINDFLKTSNFELGLKATQNQERKNLLVDNTKN